MEPDDPRPYRIKFYKGLAGIGDKYGEAIVQAWTAADAITQFNADVDHNGDTGLGKHRILHVEPFIPPKD
jgi:hypothetical protein